MLTKSVKNKNRITNNKLSKTIIDRLMLEKISIIENGQTKEITNITSIELDLLLYMSKIQNEFGHLEGLYYREACLAIHCCKQSFYNAMFNLKRKGYILINDMYKQIKYWNCTIIDNIFLNEKDDRKEYFNTNKKFLYSKEFMSLKVNEKKLCIKLAMNIAKDNAKKENNKHYDIYPQTVCNWVGIKSTTLAWDYINNISAIFPNSIKKGVKGDMISFAADNMIIELNNSKSERETFLNHKLKYICNIYKISYTIDEIKELVILTAQYAKVGANKLYSVITHVLLTKHSIEPKLINHLLRKDPITNEYPAIFE